MKNTDYAPTSNGLSLSKPSHLENQLDTSPSPIVSPRNETCSKNNAFLDSKLYLAGSVLLCLLYFTVVFAGMLIIHKEYEWEEPFRSTRNENNSDMIDRPYDIVEAIVLGVMILELTMKVTLASLKRIKVRNISFFKKVTLLCYRPPKCLSEMSAWIVC